MSSPLEQCVGAVEAGNWRAALRLNRQISGSPDVLAGELSAVLLAGCLIDVAESMRQRTLGNVGGAHGPAVERLDSAAQILATVDRGYLSRGRSLLPPPPSRSVQGGLALLIWRTARVVRRERSELELLRKRLEVLGKRETRVVLVTACVEHLTWISFDPQTWSAEHDPADGLALAPADDNRLVQLTREEICRRATELRHFARTDSWDVSYHAWKYAGGYRPLLAAALRTLAEPPSAAYPASGSAVRRWAEPVRPGASGPARPAWDQAPIRLPLRRAQDFARQWSRDMDFTDTSTDQV